jgi:hypothetical protein
MPALSNPRHEAFAQELFRGIAEGRSQGECFARAGYTKNPNAAKADASRLLKASKHIIARVQELQRGTARKKQVTVESIVDELDDARSIAERNEQAGAMVQATSVKAKVCGLFVQKTEVGNPGDFGALTSRAELADRMLLELNPGLVITSEKRQMYLAELDRHTAAVEAIAADDEANNPR